MQNEELTKELNALQEKFNKEIEDVKKKYEMKFEVGKWYKDKDNQFLFYLEKKGDFDYYFKGYGFSKKGDWFITSSQSTGSNLKDCIEATHEEVEKALTKEAVKRYNGFTKIKPLYNRVLDKFRENDKTFFDSDSNYFYYKGVCVLDNDKWATPIKEKTLDEIANELSFTTAADIKHKLLKLEEEIINALNKL
jgi:hypothetical protein